MQNDTWKTLNLLLPSKVSNSSCFYHNDLIFCLGGRRFSTNKRFQYIYNNIDVVDLGKDTIYTSNNIPRRAVNFSSVKYKDYLILLGGSTGINSSGNKKFTNEVHFYNLNSGYWYKLEDMPMPKEAKSVLVGDKIYLIGGFNGKILKDIETYDLITGKWENKMNLPIAMENPALASKENNIFIYEKGKFIVYNTIDNSMKMYGINISVSKSEMFVYKDFVYIVGGSIEDSNNIDKKQYMYKLNLNQLPNTKYKLYENKALN